MAGTPKGGKKLSGFTCSSDTHHAGPALGFKRECATTALGGDLKPELEVQLTGLGVSMTPYTAFHSLKVWVSHL